VEGEDSHPSTVGPELGDAERGNLVGFGVWPAPAPGEGEI